MGKTILVIAFALMVGLLFVAGACLKKDVTVQAPPDATANTPENQAQQQAQVEQYASKTTTAMESGNTDTCASIQDERFRTSCVDNVLLKKATDTSDLTVCQQIVSEGMRTSCSDTIYVKKAIAERTPSYCNNVKDLNSKTLCLNMASS